MNEKAQAGRALYTICGGVAISATHPPEELHEALPQPSVRQREAIAMEFSTAHSKRHAFDHSDREEWWEGCGYPAAWCVKRYHGSCALLRSRPHSLASFCGNDSRGVMAVK